MFVIIAVLLCAETIRADSYEDQHKSKAREHTEQQSKLYGNMFGNMNSSEEIIALREKRFEEDEAFRLELHKEDMTQLEKLLAAKPGIPASDKEELHKTMEDRYQKTVQEHRMMMEEENAFFKKLCDDKNLSQQDKQRKARNYMQQRRSDYSEYCNRTRAEGNRIVQEFFTKHK